MKKEANKVWLHHATKDSICVVVNSKKYKDALGDEGFTKDRAEAIKQRAAQSEVITKENKIKELKIYAIGLSNDELGSLFDIVDIELVSRGLLETKEGEENAK